MNVECNTMNTSATSLYLSDQSFVSLVESEATTPRHPYNTRLSAKLSAQQSKSSLASIISARSLVVNLSKSATDKTTPIHSLENGLKSVQKEPKVWCRSGEKFSGNFNSVSMRRSIPIYPCPRPPSCWEKAFKSIVLFLTIGTIVMFCIYLGTSLSDSQGSLHSVTKQLCNIKNEMEGMKEDVVNSRHDTEKKLEIIEELLRELKGSTKPIVESKKCPSKQEYTSEGGNDIKKEISEALEAYDADKTGKRDFALESAGGSILSVRDTEGYPSGTTVTFFGVSLCEAGKGPRAMINPGTLPGECWAFSGSKGSAIIHLLGSVKITSVSLEHISKAISPTGVINTAPKEFSIWGLSSENDQTGTLLGKFVYDADGPSIQFFEIEACPRPYSIMEFKVHSNHGHPDFTCVYRLRVHGDLASKF